MAMAIPNKINMPFNATQNIVLTITKDTTKEELDAIKSALIQLGFSFDYSNVDFNENQEIVGKYIQ